MKILKVDKDKVKLMRRFCDKKCNSCPLVGHPNSRMLTKILNELFEKFGDGVYKIIEENCPNLTCCHDCRIDDFVHVEGCELSKS